MVLSLQGCMAVGKTTAARYLQRHTPQVQVFFESTGDMIPHMLPLKRAWFAQKDNVDWLSVDTLTPEQVGRSVQDWCLDCLRRAE